MTKNNFSCIVFLVQYFMYLKLIKNEYYILTPVNFGLDVITIK